MGRFACAPFGHKVSNTGLAILTDTVVEWLSRWLEINSGAYVDDFFNALDVLLHGFCEGLAGGCATCCAAAAAGQPKFDAMDKMMSDCALTFSTKGDMTLSQRHLFISIIFNTHRGRMFVSAEKFAKLMALLKRIMELVTCSPRNMSKLRGKAKHQFRCLEGVRPLLVGFDRFIGGPDSMYAWDKETEIAPHLGGSMGFLYQHLPRLQVEGAEMWPMDPTTLYFRWSRGLQHPYGELIVATWDASVKGVAISLCVRPGEILYLEGMRFEGVTTIVKFEDTPEAQVHREAAGAPTVMRLCRR